MLIESFTALDPQRTVQTAADGGYASRANLTAAKTRGVADVAFHKKCGIAAADMVKRPWVYRRLRNFRAGIEAGISCFKRVYGEWATSVRQRWAAVPVTSASPSAAVCSSARLAWVAAISSP